MRSLLLWLIGLIGGGVLINLLSAEIYDWLPAISRRIVRHQAAKMGARAGRYEEEWLADLDNTPGRMAQLLVALGTLVVPLLTVSGFSRSGAADWLRDHAWWLTLLCLALLVIAYPPHPSRYPAYAVLVPVILFCGWYLAPSFRDALARGYGRLNYFGRVGVGSLMMPIIGLVAIGSSLIPPQRRPPTQAPPEQKSARPPVLIFMATSRDSDRRVMQTANKTTKVKLRPGAAKAQETLALQVRPEPPRPLDLEPLRLSDLPSIPLPEQPISVTRTFATPTPPSNLRIIK